MRWNEIQLDLHYLFQGIRARILETLVMLVLLALLILGMVWVASALVDKDAASMESLYGQSASLRDLEPAYDYTFAVVNVVVILCVVSPCC